jgi:hypothetical protein
LVVGQGRSVHRSGAEELLEDLEVPENAMNEVNLRGDGDCRSYVTDILIDGRPAINRARSFRRTGMRLVIELDARQP